MTNKQQSQLSISITAVKKLVLTTCILVLPATIQSCTLPAQSVNITGATKSMQFRFEDYKTAEAARKKLLELYPVGSDVSKFDKDMQLLGYKRLIDDEGLNFEHIISISAAGGDSWDVDARYSNGKITKLRVSKQFSSY
jgi:hypothetical protein